MEKIRVFIADDDPLARVALTHFATRDPKIAVVGESGNGREALEAIKDLQPDIVTVEMRMTGIDGIETTQAIIERWPSIRVIVVTTCDSFEVVLAMLHAGASGYLLKDSSADEIVSALRQVLQGGVPLSPRVAALLVKHVRDRKPRQANQLEQLTEREFQILQYLAQGMSNTEIARAMYVAEATIKAYLGSMMSKWLVRDRVQLLITAARAGIIDFQ